MREIIECRAITSEGPRAHVSTADTVGVLPLRPVITALTPQATVTFVRAESTITLAIRPIWSLCGRSMTFTATVAAAPPGSGTPTGTVTFSADDGPATPVTLADGVATFTTQLNAGSHTVTASYTGDTHFHAAPLTTLTTHIWRTGFSGF